MATKTTLTGMKPVDKLTGHIQGKRFSIVLDDMKVGDKWSAEILPVLQSDGVGKAIIDDGVTFFKFPTAHESTIEFVAAEGNLSIHQFYEKDDGKEKA